ncbi:MAG: hypothetical protein V4465_01125 [Patescibacteria group bacterium]
MTSVKGKFKEPVEIEANFARSGQNVLGYANLFGVLMTITATPDGLVAFQGQKYLVRLDGEFKYDTGPMTGSATGTILRKAGSAIATEVAEFTESEDVEYTDIDLEFMRGRNTTTGADQWECRLYDKTTEVTTLYVADKYAGIQPRMNGEHYACIFGRKLYRSPDGKFIIQLVELVERFNPEVPAERRRVRRNRLTRAQIRSSSAGRRKQAEDKKKGKAKKDTRGRGNRAAA